MRHLYTLKWAVFVNWCATRGVEPATCEIHLVLPFLQELLEAGRTPSTLKVYMAAITAFHTTVAGQSLGRSDLIIRFLKGAGRLN